ncbi:MAG: MBOAT family protein [Bacteroidetes bacterium]|nr:MBOAT family protein [Bacteroidota bacterium]
MVFSSALFLFGFLPVFLLIYYSLPQKFKNHFLLFASLLFFAWGAPLFVFFVIGSLILDLYLVRKMEQATVSKEKKIFLLASIVLNVGSLAYFKYANFFIENINELFSTWGAGAVANWTDIALPIGISFFTFKKLSYTIDVYRQTHRSFDSIANYFLFILLFPELVAGPIVRYNEIADQIIDRKDKETIDHKLSGLYRFIIGLSKKVLIANVLGAEADKIFDSSFQLINTADAWLGIIAYTFQIYFDFSGYSDMAIGIARMLGFTFPENFNSPYTSQSITEFWQRWHTTLGRWMRDYLYIPLGGNRVESNKRLYFNLAFVFFISGLWHGASWNFIVWGCYHGFFLIIERMFLNSFYGKIGKLPSMIITFFVVMIGWVFFRAEDMGDAMRYLHKLFVVDLHPTHQIYLIDFYVILGIAAMLSFMNVFKFQQAIEKSIYFNFYSNKRTLILGLICYTLLILSASAMVSASFNPFIYYRF